MRILSQDGMIDVPYENFVLLITQDNCIVATRDTVSRPLKIARGVIATYSTRKKAISAMEMLRNAYTQMPVILNNIDITEDVEKMFERTKMNGILAITDDKKSKIEYINNVVFQFPKDEDVEG